ncbi:MAG: arylesterase [Pseudorhodoplanes sp.]
MIAIACAFFAASARAGEPVRLVALGDSLTAGFELAGRNAFPAKLQAALKARGRDVVIENAGVSGDTARGGLDRLDWSVPPGTQGVILELGANDMLRGIDPAITRKALEEILMRLKARGVPVLLCGMKAASNLGADYVRAFDAIYPELAERFGLVLYPFFLEGVIGQTRLTLPDGLHPSEEGVEAIVQGILPFAEQFVDRIGAGQKG